MQKLNTEKSRLLYESTKQYLVGGVASSFHKGAHEDYPLCFSRGKGSKLYDVDGNEYIDYVAGLCPMLLGYSPDAVNKAIAEQLEKGSHFSGTTPEIAELSKRITEIIPSAERVVFQNSGTEAVMTALRFARAYTGKNKIIKFEGHYHGWSDEEKVTIDASSLQDLGEYDAPARIITTKGQRTAAADDIIVSPWNSLPALEGILKEHQDQVAAMIMEPFMCDNGPVPPLPGYLAGAKELAEKYGCLLIFDEVITGFRFALGGVQEYFGVTPHMSVFAKAATAGFPMSFVVGRKDIMEAGVVVSGTFNGNPMCAAAALAAIREYQKPGFYEGLERIGKLFSEGLHKLGKKYGLPVISENFGGLVTLTFSEHPIHDFRDWLTYADQKLYNELTYTCRSYGVRISNKKGRLCISAAHTEEDVKKTLEIMDIAMGEITGK